MAEARCISLSRSLLRHERASVRFSSEFQRGARDDTRERREYIKMKTMPATLGQWRVAPCTGILEALHTSFIWAEDRTGFELLTLLRERCNLCERIRPSVVEQRATFSGIRCLAMEMGRGLLEPLTLKGNEG